MITETAAKPPLHQRAMHELKELVFISLYLYIALCLAMYKHAIARSDFLAG